MLREVGVGAGVGVLRINVLRLASIEVGLVKGEWWSGMLDVNHARWAWRCCAVLAGFARRLRFECRVQGAVGVRADDREKKPRYFQADLSGCLEGRD